jgi:Fe-S cluster biogenesis protein NfuA
MSMNLEELRGRIESVLSATVRPLLGAGSEVRLKDVTSDGVARITFIGACPACPSVTLTVMTALERELARTVPQVAYVELVPEA